jgi:hypothetical protein
VVQTLVCGRSLERVFAQHPFEQVFAGIANCFPVLLEFDFLLQYVGKYLVVGFSFEWGVAAKQNV